ncbi:rRNA maturation RNase YbeY [Candidatus Uhrbacteria bacterium]|nr:rRNA maturation RNase YbeY [Candidatus Uhrbacteria bacterium]
MITLEYMPGRERPRLSRAALEEAAALVGKTLGVRTTLPVSVALVGKSAMQKLNHAYRGVDAPTDVLSFSYDDEEVFGEVVICPAIAKGQAQAEGIAVRTELLTLFVHGLLHLFGFDHIRAKDARVMIPLQERILARLL